ncbi:helix-turn-helix domain-containing protein [Couchioplanes caeruleus]|uniref:helix-turn-helix domain-containing protein n=1 Tax=Couchioplanes caeruleus TaxID=56438 RepID=UPI0020BD8F63|nr:helix-turn-helix domain-containing protein [Couchioplanes caeruleus]UQU67107.1 helix-turn-helix domain-containing protein [Couchioplanes caeruleus]
MVDEYARARPSAPLRPHVSWYSGYRQAGVAAGTHRGLPSPYLTLIFTIDDPLVVAGHPDPRQSPGRYDALAGGLHLTPATITHDGFQSGVQVALHPLACRDLLGLPAAALAATDVDAAAVLGDEAVDRIREHLRAARGWAQRFAAVDEELRRRLGRGGAHPDVAYAFDRLLDTGGRVSVAALAAETGWGARHLTRLFRAETGLGLKAAARVVRFDRARRRLRPGVGLASVAAEAGYYDQAHLAREFHAFAGCPPSQWMAEEIGFVQAVEVAEDDHGGHD